MEKATLIKVQMGQVLMWQLSLIRLLRGLLFPTSNLQLRSRAGLHLPRKVNYGTQSCGLRTSVSLQPCVLREYPVKATRDAPGPTATDQGKVSRPHLLMSLSLQCLSSVTELGKWIQKLLEETAKLARPRATKTHGAFL